MLERIIQADRSVIVAADVKSVELPNLVNKTCVVKGVGGYKVGLELVLEEGLPKIVGEIKNRTNLPVVYDHQKGGNDIPEMGKKFASVCKASGVDAVILFPFAGSKTERDWVKACQDEELGVIVGAHMTQPEFLFSEGGSVSDEAPDRIFTIAAIEGVRDFVVPGNKVEYVIHYKELLDDIIGEGAFTLYAPGFITQGGEISEFARAAGEKWHAIVGGAIYKAMDITSMTKRLTSQLR